MHIRLAGRADAGHTRWDPLADSAETWFAAPEAMKAAAVRAIEVLGDHGLRVPEQVSVTGYDDQPTVDRLTEQLSAPDATWGVLIHGGASSLPFRHTQFSPSSKEPTTDVQAD